MLLQSLPDCVLFKMALFMDPMHLILIGQTSQEFRSRCAPVILDTKHAMRMQMRWWKRQAKRFLSIRQSGNGYLSCVQLVHRLMEKDVQHMVGLFVRRICSSTNAGDRLDRNTAACTGAVLSAIINKFHPALLHRLDISRADATQLMDASSGMVKYFNRILARVARTGSFRHIPADLSANVQIFAVAINSIPFSNERRRIITRLEHALVALMAAARRIPEDEPVDSDTRAEITRQTARLREKLAEVGGALELALFDERAAARVSQFEERKK